ncbi:hypothetical protein MACK_001171 [Theileria orientalis]|uniref:Uncharacterized protein n=1 Tax=Theileria orientalis TaxID=68886 RepID=A0A976QUG9_THEOR|nr:hypothetical protein MACK_001171 [Theileria orientalis]
MDDSHQQSRSVEINENSYQGDISEEDMKLIKHLTWLYGGYSMRRRQVSSRYNENESLDKAEKLEAFQSRSKRQLAKGRGRQKRQYLEEKEVLRGHKLINRFPNQHPENKLDKRYGNWNKKQRNRGESKVLLENDGYTMKKNRKINRSEEYMSNGRNGRNKSPRDGVYKIVYEEIGANGIGEEYLAKNVGKNSSKRKGRKRGSEYAVVSGDDTDGKNVGTEEDRNTLTNGMSFTEKEVVEGGYVYNGILVPSEEVAGSVAWSNNDDIAWRLENARYLLTRRLKYNYGMNLNDRRKPSWPINYSLQNKIEDFISRKIADATEFRSKEPTTLSICNQFALQNHEAMVADSDRVHYYRAAMFWTGFNEDQSPGGARVGNTVDVIMEREVNSLDTTFTSHNMNKDLVNLASNNIVSAIELVDMDSKLAGSMDGRVDGIATPVTQNGVNSFVMDKATDFSNENDDCDLTGTIGAFETIDTTPRIEENVDDRVEYKGRFEDLKSLDDTLNQCFENSFNELEVLQSKFTTNLNYKTVDMSYENGLEGLAPIETNLNTCYSDSLHSRSTSINLDSSIYNGSEDAVSTVTNGVKYYCTGKKILEIGTGPMCVLAMNALKAGAKSVDALEVSDHASRLAGKLMAAYGFDNIIKVFNTHSKLFIFNQNEYFSDSTSNASSTSNSLNSSADNTTTNAVTPSNAATDIGIISNFASTANKTTTVTNNLADGSPRGSNVLGNDGAAASAGNNVRTNSITNINRNSGGKGARGIDDNVSGGFNNGSQKGSSEGFELRLPPYPPYDMVISEILGDFASQEGVADVFLDFQRRILFENKAFLDSVKSIPCRVSTMFVPSFFPDASNILNKSSSDHEMTIFSPSKKMLQSVGMRIDNLPICEEWLPLEHIDLEKWMLPQMCQHYVNVFKVAKFGEVAGLLVGIDVEIRPGEHFGTRYGQCESWYTNLLMFDREYTVFENDLIVVSSVANLTNYTKVNCDSSKIQVSRPSYSFKAYILSPINFEAANYAMLQSPPSKRPRKSRERSARGYDTANGVVDNVLGENGINYITAEDVSINVSEHVSINGVTIEVEDGDLDMDDSIEGADGCDVSTRSLEDEQDEDVEGVEEDMEIEHLESEQLSHEQEDPEEMETEEHQELHQEEEELEHQNREHQELEQEEQQDQDQELVDQELPEEEPEVVSEQVQQKPVQGRSRRGRRRQQAPKPAPIYITSVDAEVFNLDEFIKGHSEDKCTNNTNYSDVDTSDRFTTKNNHSSRTNKDSIASNDHSTEGINNYTDNINNSTDSINNSTEGINNSTAITKDSNSSTDHSASNENGTTATNGTNLKGHYSVKLKCNELMKISYDVTDRTKINFDNLNKTHEAVSTLCKYADDILESHEYVQLDGEIYKVMHRPEVMYIDYDEQTSTIYYDTPCAKRKMHTDPPKRYNKIKLKTAKLL